MSPITSTRGTADGFDTYSFSTGLLALTIIPELGGKISSLRDLRSGREWLWRNPRLPYRRFPHGSGYLEADTGGWDECFPSVAACHYPSAPWAGAPIQDHGELWSQATELVQREQNGQLELATRWQGVEIPYKFERIIHLRPDSALLRVAYTATNTADDPMPVIWSAHPLLAIEPGMRLLVPPEARFNVWGMFPANLLPERRGIAFPLHAGGVDLAVLPAPCGLALKLWSDPLDEGWATLQAADGALRMRSDTALLPQCAFWLNLGAWPGAPGEPYYNLGFEPCIGAQDSLEHAVQVENLFLTLPPRGSHSWWLEVELGA